MEALHKRLHQYYEKIGEIEALVIENKPDLAHRISKILDIKVDPDHDIEDYGSLELDKKGNIKQIHT